MLKTEPYNTVILLKLALGFAKKSLPTHILPCLSFKLSSTASKRLEASEDSLLKFAMWSKRDS